MARLVFAIPGDIDLPTGGYAYDRRLLALLPLLGLETRHLALPGSFPSPSAEDLETSRATLSGIGSEDVMLIDGLAFGAMPAAVIQAARSPIVALVHHPLCLEAGLASERAAELRALETAALSLAQRVIVTSPTTARTLAADFAVPQDRITVAEPGTDPAPRAKGSGGPVHMIAVGSVVPRKGYDVLIEALAILKVLDWQLDIAGALDPDPAHVDALRRLIASNGLQDRIRLHGAMDTAAVGELYDGADVLVSPSLYEGYGMVLAEALARGLCIVCTTAGAAAETVPDGAAMKVEPAGDARVLAWTLGRAIENDKARKATADAAWAAAQSLPRWEQTAARVADAVKGIMK
ncbi:MAG: glycosyltransferase family 4 protein [Hyphomicrobiaceae bacterium]